MRLGLPLLVLLLAFLCAPSARADRPLDQVRNTANKILDILKDPSLAGDDKRIERHRRIRQELEERFEWPSICRSCLGRHWAKLSREQQNQFIELFKNFLERTYLDRIEPYYDKLERIDYQGERILESNYASVKTVITTKEKIDHPVEYRLEKRPSGEWQVYDVIIEGVSLVKNYRTQFDEIITRSSFDGLLHDLQSKTAESKG